MIRWTMSALDRMKWRIENIEDGWVLEEWDLDQSKNANAPSIARDIQSRLSRQAETLNIIIIALVVLDEVQLR